MPPRLSKRCLPSAHTQFLPPLPQYQCLRTRSKQFSSTPQNETRLRREMWRWINGPGAVFKDPLPGSTNYLNAYNISGRLIRMGNDTKPVEEDQNDEGTEELPQRQNLASGDPIPAETPDDLIPFPMNRLFRSQPVLSEELREEVWRRVIQDNKSVRVVSAELGVEMNRVGAVVRLKTIEKQWMTQGKPLAIPYARAVLAMLPSTPYSNTEAPEPHEPINDLPVHNATRTQIFHPVAESRVFTRKDAGQVFSPGLLPADARVPHPELIELEKERLAGVPREERILRQRERMQLETLEAAERVRKKQQWEKMQVKKVTPPGGRWEFRFRDISVESVGPTGRDRRGVGARYGFPHEDRKRGQVKIPRRVD